MLTLLAEVPAVVLLGPRQSGKTTLALHVAAGRPSLYLDLESPRDRAKLTDPEAYLALHRDKLIVLDEVQRNPELFPILRGVIDEGRHVDLLVDLLLLQRLEPWHANAGKRLVKSPKVYLRDSGLVHALLGLADAEDVLGHPVAGVSAARRGERHGCGCAGRRTRGRRVTCQPTRALKSS